MLSHEQKNKNILSRFDSQKSGSQISRFRVKLDTHTMTVISLDGMTHQQCVAMLRKKYAGRVLNVE